MPADQPDLPPPRTTLLVKVWGSLIVAALGCYGVASFMGWDWGGAQRDEVPASVRGSPGGYRSFHFWHSGYHGGK